ncbi:MAG TPA: hypothetical protein VFC78_02815 [Tepidisphaeraceae bacterium]|nr:hypothetical protein [Tepidisphaeraceae bacterium]
MPRQSHSVNTFHQSQPQELSVEVGSETYQIVSGDHPIDHEQCLIYIPTRTRTEDMLSTTAAAVSQAWAERTAIYAATLYEKWNAFTAQAEVLADDDFEPNEDDGPQFVAAFDELVRLGVRFDPTFSEMMKSWKPVYNNDRISGQLLESFVDDQEEDRQERDVDDGDELDPAWEDDMPGDCMHNPRCNDAMTNKSCAEVISGQSHFGGTNKLGSLPSSNGVFTVGANLTSASGMPSIQTPIDQQANALREQVRKEQERQQELKARGTALKARIVVAAPRVRSEQEQRARDAQAVRLRQFHAEKVRIRTQQCQVVKHYGKMRPVWCLELRRRFDSITQAAKFVKRSPSNILQAIKFSVKAGGYHWQIFDPSKHGSDADDLEQMLQRIPSKMCG